MVKALMKQPLFVIGFLFVTVFLIGSFAYYFIYDDEIPKTILLYDENHNLIAESPLTPSEAPPFGTDKRGQDMGKLILVGAKYTILGAAGIAFLRMLFSFLFGVIYGNYLYKYKRFFTGIVDSFSVIPLTLLAYLVLVGVLNMNIMTSQFEYGFWARIFFEVMILAVIAVPIVTVLIGNEIGAVLSNEYIECAKLLGGSRLQIFKRHVMPHILPRLFVVFVQQIISVMIIMGHLGVLMLFFGGTILQRRDPPFSLTNEWAGLVGANVDTFMIRPWLVLGPILMFTLTVLAFNFMLVGIQKAMAYHKAVRGAYRAPETAQEELTSKESHHREPFAFVHRKVSTS